ncbi:MAG: hypothetical protein AABZ02_13005 [Bacteroidota bacterium]
MNTFSALMRLVFVLSLALYIQGCTCPQPQIDSINPSSGPAGTIVEVTFTGGGLGGVVVFDGVAQETRFASNLGLGHILRFTIPYGATTGSKSVQVSSSGQTSPAVAFQVTGPGNVPTPALDAFEVATREGKEITVFGSGFSTVSKVFIDGVEVQRYGGSSQPLREIPFDFVDNIIICTPASDLLSGSAHTVQVRNPNNLNSNTLNITIPSRVCEMELDALTGVPIPNYYVLRNNTINTLRRSYNACGWIIELSYNDTAVADPQAGAVFTNADLYSFWQANANVPANETYMHGAFLTAHQDGILGIMFMNTGSVPSLPNVERRLGYAAFRNAFGANQREERYLRTTIHEAGHGFNLLHSDGDGSTTIMNQTGSLANNWTHNFSNVSCTHLRSHTLNAVRPGGEAFGSSRSCNNLH